MFSSRIALGIGIAAAALLLAVIAFAGWPFLGIILLLVLLPGLALVAVAGGGAKKAERQPREWKGAPDELDRRGAVRADGGMISDRERAVAP